MTLILSATDLEPLADMKLTIDSIERALEHAATGTAHNPLPSSVWLPSSSAKFLAMPAVADWEGLAAVKFLADIPANREKGLPAQRSTILLTSQETGETLAILDGRVPTKHRTAAASAVASKYLAREDSSCLGLVGAGPLAVAHLEAMLLVFPIKKVMVWSRSQATSERFLVGAARFDVDIQFVDNIADVFSTADIICTLTPSCEPLVKGSWFRPGQHINAIGAPPRADHREIDTEGMLRSTIFVDHVATVLEKSGEVAIPLAAGTLKEEDIRRELGDVIAGRIPGRTSPEEITLFDSVGLGLQDLAIGRLLYDAARAAGVGTEIDLSR